MYRKFLTVILSLSMIQLIIANNNLSKSSNSNNAMPKKEPSIKVSMESIAVGFSNTSGDCLDIKEILLLAENYCLEEKITFPITESRINITIEPNVTGPGLKIVVYFWHKSHKLLIVTINDRRKVSTHTISNWAPG